LRSRDGPHHHSQTLGRWRPPCQLKRPPFPGPTTSTPILRGSLVGPTRFRPLEPLNEISTHFTVSCLETPRRAATLRLALGCHRAGWPPARRYEWPRPLGPAWIWAIRVHHDLADGRRRTRHLLQSRSIAEDKPGALPRSPLALWRQGPDGGLGLERLQHAKQAGLLRSEP
jgi:hypothetical protein